jgi:hypothetical protein
MMTSVGSSVPGGGGGGATASALTGAPGFSFFCDFRGCSAFGSDSRDAADAATAAIMRMSSSRAAMGTASGYSL